MTLRQPDLFQPTLPARGATDTLSRQNRTITISTHAPRTGSDGLRRTQGLSWRISTHAPRTGSDPAKIQNTSIGIDFNPRSPHGERLSHGFECQPFLRFQPTLPARGATYTSASSSLPSRLFQPTLPARGATKNLEDAIASMTISTHAPRTGSDRRR